MLALWKFSADPQTVQSGQMEQQAHAAAEQECGKGCMILFTELLERAGSILHLSMLLGYPAGPSRRVPEENCGSTDLITHSTTHQSGHAWSPAPGSPHTLAPLNRWQQFSYSLGRPQDTLCITT